MAIIFFFVFAILEGASTGQLEKTRAILPYTFPPGLNLVSAPYDYPQEDPYELLGKPRDFGMASWWAGQYILYPNFPADKLRIGRGFWLKTKEICQITQGGVPAPTSEPYRIPISFGWNLIGCPFPFEAGIDWNLARVETSQGEFSLLEAMARGIIKNGLWTWTYSGYTFAYFLEPWRGYWFKTGRKEDYDKYQPCVLLIPPPGREATKNPEVTKKLSKGTNWQIRLLAIAGNLRDSSCCFGVAADARDSFDNLHDAEKPPMPGFQPYVSLYFPHNSWGPDSGNYAIDIRAPFAGTKTWDLEVKTDLPNAEVVITWPDLSEAPRNYRLTLIDLDANRSIYMRTISSYTYKSGPAGGLRRFRIQVTSCPKEILRISNISIKSNRSGLSISYFASCEASVDISICNLSGKVIRALAKDLRISAGINTLTWDGKDEQGALVPNGPYLCQILGKTEDRGKVKVSQTFLLMK